MYPELKAKVIEIAKSLRQGDPSGDVDVGACTFGPQVDKIRSLLQFRLVGGRPGSMSTFGLVNPSVSLARLTDPIELPEAAAPLSLIRFQSNKYKIQGSGAVRHCHRVGPKYIVGLEFTDGIRWQPPEGDVVEPISLCRE